MTVLIPETESATPADVALLTAHYGVIPDDYLEFINHHYGADAPVGNNLRDTDGDIAVRTFLTAEEIIIRSHRVEGMSKKFMAFANDNCGNYFCMDKYDHLIYFHDRDRNEDLIIARSFAEFLEKLDMYDWEPDQYR